MDELELLHVLAVGAGAEEAFLRLVRDAERYRWLTGDRTMNTEARDECLQMTRVKNDVNGNPRHVVHWLGLEPATPAGLDISARYDRVVRAARAAGGRKFHTRQYDGGVVFQAYACEMPERVACVRALLA